MSRILGRNTRPEMAVRKLVKGLGYRYRLNARNLPGKPDIVLTEHNRAIFIHGCFWHFHGKCVDGRIPKTRKSYWRTKLLGNQARDKRRVRELQNIGWKTTRLWECDIERKPEKVLSVLKRIAVGASA
jgi:DNA mismatch endonuclease (patch repair protein)